jgi:DNA polymerase-1
MIEAYFETYPKLKGIYGRTGNKARQMGYVETILGRKRHLKDINSNNFVVRGHAERNAVNAPVQGSAAYCENSYDKIDRELEEQQLKTKCYFRYMTNWYLKHRQTKLKPLQN